MTVEDALRKISLLRKIRTDNGALAAEAEAAYRLQKALMERFSIKSQDVPDGQTTSPFRLSWTYWQELFEEFDLNLSHFGGRGSAEISYTMMVYVRLAANEWWIEEKSARGWQPTVRDRGIDSLRAYLREHAPKKYSFLKRG